MNKVFRASGTVLATALLAIAMTGCSSPTAPTPPITPSQTETPLAPQPPLPWVPSQTIQVPARLSDGDAMDQRAEYLKREASGEGLIDPPSVDLVRWTSYLDWGQTVAQCLQEAGFNVQGVGGILTYPDGIRPDTGVTPSSTETGG